MEEEAIKLAIEKGGYKNHVGRTDPISKLYLTNDPTFWMSLGRALGWAEKNYACPTCWKPFTHAAYIEDWKYHALRYFELVLTKGDTEGFLDKLLKQRV